jgi:hypothetical protein
VNNNQYVEKIFYAAERPKPLFTLNNPILVCKAERIVGYRKALSRLDRSAVGDQPWVISSSFHYQDFRQHALKPAWIMMVARDGVEPPTPAFSGPKLTVITTTSWHGWR